MKVVTSPRLVCYFLLFLAQRGAAVAETDEVFEDHLRKHRSDNFFLLADDDDDDTASLLVTRCHSDADNAVDKVVVTTKMQKRKIPATLFGFNIVYSWEKDSYWSGNMAPQFNFASDLHHTKDAFWRYPGGEVTSAFHWKEPNGQGWSDSWNPKFDGQYHSNTDWMSLWEYMKLKNTTGGLGMLGVNARSGWKFNRDQEGLEEASDLATIVKAFAESGKTHWKVDYWFIDNEQYTEWTPSLYADYIKMYGKELRKILPAAKFIANWGHNAENPGWTTLLREAGQYIQMMDAHMYWSKRGWATTTWDDYESGTHQVIKLKDDVTYRSHVETLKMKAKAEGLDNMEVGYLEWGLSPSPEGKDLSRFQAAFIVADIFIQMIDSDLDHACYWPLRAQGGGFPTRAMVDENNQPTVVRTFLQFFKEIKGCTLVTSKNQFDRTQTLSAICGGGRVAVYIIRKVKWPSPIQITGDFNISSKTAKAVSYYAKDGNTTVDSAQWSSPPVEIDKNSARLTVSGWSLTRVLFT